MQSERHDLTAEVQAIRDRLRHVYWIGGGSAAGKSTISRRLAAEYVLQAYSTDDVMQDHARRSTAEDCPLLHKFMAMSMDERWVNRSPQEMLETFHWFRGEGFSLIIEDLLTFSKDTGVVAEGFRLLPHLVKPLLADPDHAVWLIPTPEFRKAVIDGRGGAAWEFIARTGDPERALRNFVERDAMFTDRLKEEAQRLEMNIIQVDSTLTENEVTGRVAELFRL
jgi:cytidylate kinase